MCRLQSRAIPQDRAVRRIEAERPQPEVWKSLASGRLSDRGKLSVRKAERDKLSAAKAERLRRLSRRKAYQEKKLVLEL